MTKSFAKLSLELFRHKTVNEEVGGEVEHDEEVSHGLQAHDQERGDVLLYIVQAGNLVI